MEPEERSVRGTTYREHLGHLPDDAWAYAVDQAVASVQWFPTVAEMLAFAHDAPSLVPESATEDESAETYWRRTEGSTARRVAGHEHDRDPDWSLPEIAAQRVELAEEFFGWLSARNAGFEDHAGPEVSLDEWCASRWGTPLTSAAKAVLLFEVKERQRRVPRLVRPSGVELRQYEATVRSNQRRPHEPPLAYMERIAVLAGGVDPTAAALNPVKGPWFDAWSVAPSDLEERDAIQAELAVPVPPVTAPRLPYSERE